MYSLYYKMYSDFHLMLLSISAWVTDQKSVVVVAVAVAAAAAAAAAAAVAVNTSSSSSKFYFQQNTTMIQEQRHLWISVICTLKHCCILPVVTSEVVRLIKLAAKTCNKLMSWYGDRWLKLYSETLADPTLTLFRSQCLFQEICKVPILYTVTSTNDNPVLMTHKCATRHQCI